MYVTGFWLQAEAEGLHRRVAGLDEEVQLSRRAAAERQQENEDLRAALRDSQAEAEALRADVGRSQFRLGDLQQTVTQLQVQSTMLRTHHLSIPIQLHVICRYCSLPGYQFLQMHVLCHLHDFQLRVACNGMLWHVGVPG